MLVEPKYSGALHPNGVQAVLFDLDGTLRYNRPSSERVFLDVAAALGAPSLREAQRAALRWVHFYWAQSEELVQDLQAFPAEDEFFWHNYARRKLGKLGCTPAVIETLIGPLTDYMAREHQPEDYVPPETFTTLDTLQSAGFRLGLVTNRRRPCQELLQTLGLSDYFEVTVVAGEVGLWKPGPEIFTHALAQLDLPPQAAVYVGDNYFADVLGARAANLPGVLIDPDEIFDELDCPVIQRLDGLLDLLAAK
jgi:putative hydrolase of the HAD superfamily